MKKRTFVIGVMLAIVIFATSVMAATRPERFQMFWRGDRNISASLHDQIGRVNDLAAQTENYNQQDLHRFVRVQNRINKMLFLVVSSPEIIKRAQEIYEVED